MRASVIAGSDATRQPRVPPWFWLASLRSQGESSFGDAREEVRVKIDERDDGVLAFVDTDGRIWAQCARPSQYAADTDYVIEGPLSGFIYEEGTFTPDSEQAFRAWLDDRLISDGIFHVKDKETALSLCRRIAVAARDILTDRPASSRCPR